MNLPRRALIIDDQHTLASVYKKILTDIGIHKVHIAPTASIGLKGYIMDRPGLVVLEINLKDSDGLKLLKDIRSHDPNANIIILTTVSDKTTVLDCLKSGAKNYILKSDEVADVAAKLLATMRKLDFNRVEFMTN